MSNPVISEAATSGQVRAFHLTGEGLESFVPSMPPRPALLAGVAAEEPPTGGFTELLEQYAKALREQRSQARVRFLGEVRYCRDRMQELLTLDDNRDPSISKTPGAVSKALGHGISFFDSGALALALQTSTTRPVERMGAVRRQRCESTLRALNEALREAATQPLYWELTAAGDGAIAFCRRQLDALVAGLKAVRVARLEMESAYDPAIHDEALERFDWESANTEELAAMPPVLVADSATQVAEKSLTAFGRLLRSGLPLQILITCPPFYTGDLAFLAVAHREAFVLQSSIACPAHLTEGLMDMTRTFRPAVAVVAIADPALFHESRTFPLYVYDPDGGEDWTQRFRLRAPAAMPQSGVNAVHVAALSPAMARHFRVLRQESWSPEQEELAVYLGRFRTQAPLAVPFIWVLDEAGEQQRAVLSRELVLAARDRLNAWRLLEELADAGKPAAPPVDVEAIRREAAKDAIYQAVGMLGGNGSGAAVASAAPVSKAPVAATAAPAVVAAAAAEAPVDPYIDSELCTSCNDCMKINSRLFLYNADKQAYIGDAKAGTFAELVKAAEGCPARCIHPGSPRAGDRTATPQLTGRAAKFN